MLPRTCNLCPGKTSRGETPARTPASYAERHTNRPDHTDVTARPPDAQPPCSAAVTTQRSPAKPRATPARLQPGAHPRPPPAWAGCLRASCEQSRTAAFASPHPVPFTGRHVLSPAAPQMGSGPHPPEGRVILRCADGPRCLSCSRTPGLLPPPSRWEPASVNSSRGPALLSPGCTPGAELRGHVVLPRSGS